MSTRVPLEQINCPACPELAYGTYKGYDAVVCTETADPQIVLWGTGAEFSERSRQSAVTTSSETNPRPSTASTTETEVHDDD
ncbi:hypothetical protein [Natronolimnobius baerhuensis]|uniref:hypothetical protein n=1 Tax=Natronolimnobius baerhuensis TaxID=253108 RepID=UPI0011250787|nr:hypothetical protein [Natronolimnobius baerhuensis]